MSTVKIAVVQMEVKAGQVADNRGRALAHAAEALAKGADIILFPEEMLIGYHLDIPRLAEPVDGPTTRAFQKLLVGRDAMVLYGLTEREGADTYVAATLVSAGGVVANYRKTHLWWASEGLRHEPGFYKPGNKLVTFDVKGHKSGVMICYDGDFPETTRSYANLGCLMLFWMNNRGSRAHAEVTHLACNNSIIMATSCPCGKDEANRDCPGGSNITGFYGELITEIWNAEGIIYADVDPAGVMAQRARNPWYVGRRPDLYV